MRSVAIEVVGAAIALGILAEELLDVFGIGADALLVAVVALDENNTKAYAENVSRLTGIGADDPLGIPSESPARWIAVGAAMAIQENGITSIDWFAMLRGWEMARG